MNVCEVPEKTKMVRNPKIKKMELLLEKRNYEWDNEIFRSTVVTQDSNIPNSYGDRFIPRRYMLCNNERNGKFAKKETTEDVLKTRFSMRHSRQNGFCLAINQSFGIKDRRILEFSDLNIKSSNTLVNDISKEFIYGRLNGYDWPCKPRSKPLAFTDTTHDLPGYDFSSGLNMVDWSVNEQIVAAFGRDLIIWKRCEDLTMVYSIKSSRAISYCPNGKYLAIGCKTRCWPIVELWDTSSYNDFVVMNGKVFGQKHANILCIEWSKSGNQIVCGTHSGTIYVLSVPDLKTIKKIQKHNLPITKIKFSPTMRYLACGDVEGNITILSWNTYEVYVHVRSRRKLKVSFDWHPWNGVDLAISEEMPASIFIFNVPSIEIVAYYQRKDFKISIDSVTFSKLTAELLVSVSEYTTDGCINTEILVMSSLDRIVDILKLPESGARFMMWSPDGTKLASAGNDETLTIWNFHYGSGIQTKSLILKKKDLKQPFGAPFGLQFNMWSSFK